MSSIEVLEEYPPCRKASPYTGGESVLHMSLYEIRESLLRGYNVALFVKGWKTPWECFLDENGELRAQCPAHSYVQPKIVSVRNYSEYTTTYREGTEDGFPEEGELR